MLVRTAAEAGFVEVRIGLPDLRAALTPFDFRREDLSQPSHQCQPLASGKHLEQPCLCGPIRIRKPLSGVKAVCAEGFGGVTRSTRCRRNSTSLRKQHFLCLGQFTRRQSDDVDATGMLSCEPHNTVRSCWHLIAEQRLNSLSGQVVC